MKTVKTYIPKLLNLKINIWRLTKQPKAKSDLNFWGFKAYERINLKINEIGKMLGGWIKKEQVSDHKGKPHSVSLDTNQGGDP